MRKYWLAALTIFVVTVCAWSFTVLFERYEEEVDVGYSKEAKQNPYLAAQRFLERNGVAVREQTIALDFSVIPTEDTVFLSIVDSMLLTESQIDKALDWIAQGGLLVIGVDQEIEGHDSLLARFDIEPEYVNEADAEAGEFGQAIIDALEKFKDAERYTIELADNQDQLSVEVLDNIVLNHPDIDYATNQKQSQHQAASDYELTASVSNDDGAKLLQFAHGKGELTVLSSTTFWQNEHIGEADHAYLLAYLLPSEGTVHLFYNISMPPLYDLLGHYYAELVLACAALLALWLWRISLRIQGTRVVVDGQRRNFTEHLTASAEFLASKKQYQPLITPIKDDINAQMQLYHPGFAKLDTKTQTALIAQRVGLSEDMIEQWIAYTNTVDDQPALLDALKLGNAIRRKL